MDIACAEAAAGGGAASAASCAGWPAKGPQKSMRTVGLLLSAVAAGLAVSGDGSSADAHDAPTASSQRQGPKIEHFVLLLMENRAADHMFGCMGLPGFDGIAPGHTLPKDPADPSRGHVNVTCTGAEYVCQNLSGYDTFASKFGGNGSNPNRYPYSAQHDQNSALHGAAGTAVQLFAPDQLPIKSALAREFGVFNKLYTAVPAASNPNHLFIQSATSCGLTSNGLYNDCGGKTVTFPQRTIYDNMADHNVSFGWFMNTTCGLDGHQCTGPQHPQFSIPAPDVAMQGVARFKRRYFSQELFYQQAANGSLPQFSWLNPAFQASDHPCQDVAKGERLLKDVYESLRAGPKWQQTLLFVAYDDGGGYYDHVVPPHEGVPADESPCHVAGARNTTACGPAFDFRRLGLRSGAMLISPWVKRGRVFQEPRNGPFPTSQFELTSVPATIKRLFNLSSFLTKRDAWAGSFTELLADQPRDDAPFHLPRPPDPTSPWVPAPPAGSDAEEESEARHCSARHPAEQSGACQGAPIALLARFCLWLRGLVMFDKLTDPVRDRLQGRAFQTPNS